MASKLYGCQVCNKEFSAERGLHSHLKAHQITQAEYYCRHYPRYNKLTGDPLPFKNKADYFHKDFSTYQQLLKWCDQASDEEVRPYILEQLKYRIKEKDLSFGPCHLELKQKKLPPIDVYKRIFGSYTAACEEAGVKPLYGNPVKKQFFVKDEKFNRLNVFIDTREQKPLTFPRSQSLKLDFGDYTLGGENYNYTYVDRKSEADFKSTLGMGFKRFAAELDRAKHFQSYLYVVTESDPSSIGRNNNFGPHKSNLEYIYHNMRKLIREYAGHCQFLFTGNRERSRTLIPRLLYFGKDLWGSDIQYYLDKDAPIA